MHIEVNALEPANPILYWTHTLPDASQPTANNIVRVYRDGVWEKTVTGHNQTGITPVRPGAIVDQVRQGGYVNYELEALTPLESGLTDTQMAFSVYPQGDRVRLTWTQCTAQDFDSYLLYWNGGGTASPATLLKRVQGSDNLAYTTQQLTNGETYKFALSLRDVVGNETAIGTVYSVVADAPPKALQGATISYSAATRKATITGVHPNDQHNDLGGVSLHNNYMPGIGLSEYPNVGYEQRAAFSYTTTGTVTFTTHELSAGQWRFAMRPVDRFGLQANYSVLTINLVQSGTTLAIGSIQPLAPTGVIAYATANAGAVLSWFHGGANTNAYKIYTGATLLATQTKTGASPETKEIAGLADGTTYTFTVYAYNGGIASPASAGATATMDGTAPSASKALSLELIH